MWYDIWQQYLKDWQAHTKDELIIQVLSIFFILIIGMIAIKIIGKKSISQMTLINVLFLLVLSTTLGALITKPVRIFVALLVVATIVLFGVALERLQVRFNALEKMFIGKPSVLCKNSQLQDKALAKNYITIDQLESKLREAGIPSFEACKTIILEPTGGISVEVNPEYEPIKKIYFDKAVEQILKAIDEKLIYQEAVLDIKNNFFEEASKGFNQKNVKKLD